ncbi:MAG TPA: rRNA maturation RNase YbeY [Sulfurovum sp.]|nr:rRNA maturation RNase YbeY [Sulfurovum sp.]
MIDLDNQTTLHVDLTALEKIASSLSTKDVELVITDDETMKHLNLEHRGKDSTTDVLSFPLATPFTQQSDTSLPLGLPLGSIVISSSYVEDKAIELGHSIQDELSLLFMHGLLHLLGFDHEVDDGKMRQREEALIKTFDLPQSLIIRTGE